MDFRFHDLRRTFATHANANGVEYEMIKRALNHKANTVTSGYIITQINTLRPVFEAVADGYHSYYDPDGKTHLGVENEPSEPREPIVFPDYSR